MKVSALIASIGLAAAIQKPMAGDMPDLCQCFDKGDGKCIKGDNKYWANSGTCTDNCSLIKYCPKSWDYKKPATEDKA